LKYHLSSKLDADHFLSILDHKQVSIADKIETNRTEQIKLNRSRLIPIIECVVLCGRQEIALRGHRDSGKINGNYWDFLLCITYYDNVKWLSHLYFSLLMDIYYCRI